MKLLTLLLTLLILISCNKEKKAGSSLVYCSESSPSAFNPQIVTDGTSMNASARPLHDNLVHFKYGETQLEPGLAEKWDVSNDGLTYTFNLRKGVKFHTTKYFTPTRDFNADDVLFSFNRQRNKDHPFHAINGGKYTYWQAMGMDKMITSIKKINDYTLEIKLNKPEAPFLANLAMPFASILSKEYADQLLKANKKEDIDFYPVGTGPFVFKSYAKDTLIRYTANKNYWGGVPAIKKLVFSITPDPSVRTQKLKTGECHIITEPSPQDLDDLKKSADVKVVSQEGLNVGYLAFNTQKKPFDNPKIRQAINLALNREAYIEAIYLGRARVAKNPLPPTIWSYNKNTKSHAYNLEMAKELLSQAEAMPEKVFKLWTLPVSRPYNPNGKKMGEMMQADLAKIGIQVELVTYDWPTYLAKLKNGEHDLIQLGWTGDNGDPDNFLYVLLGCQAIDDGSNVARWCNKEFDSLLQKAKVATASSQRINLYEKAQEIFNKELPWVPIAHSIVFRAMVKNLEGFKIDPLGGDYFHRVKLK